MKKWRMLLFILMMSGSFFGYHLLPVNQQTVNKKHYVTIKKVDDQWKVVIDSVESGKKEKLRVNKKETIIWSVEGSDAYFQFSSDSLFDPEGKEDSLKYGYIKYLQDGRKLKLKIKKDAPTGTFIYAVFCLADSSFATEDSPPKIIIM